MTIIGTVKSPGLNVRTRPALHAKKLDALERGDEVEILDRAAPYGYAWLKVRARSTGVESGVQSGLIGWVYAADVDIAPPPPDVTPPAPEPAPAPSPQPASPAPPAPDLDAPAPPRAPRRFFLAALALAAGLALLAWLLG
jgi:hypothetical protein